MRFSCEMLSQGPNDARAFPNKLTMHVEGRYVYIEVIAIHDGHRVASTVVVEACVFAHHVKGSGIL